MHHALYTGDCRDTEHSSPLCEDDSRRKGDRGTEQGQQLQTQVNNDSMICIIMQNGSATMYECVISNAFLACLAMQLQAIIF